MLDVEGVFAFQPDQTGKRTREEDSLQEEYENKRAADSLPSTAEEILKLVDQEPEVLATSSHATRCPRFFTSLFSISSILLYRRFLIYIPLYVALRTLYVCVCVCEG